MVKYKSFKISGEEESLVKKIVLMVRKFLYENPSADIPAIYDYFKNDPEMRKLRKGYGNSFARAFAKFNQLLLSKIPNLLEKLSYLPNDFFVCTAVTEIDLPKNIQYIEGDEHGGPFVGCKNLEVIRYLGTREEWTKLQSKSYQSSGYWNYLYTDYYGQEVTLADVGIVSCMGK